MLIPSKNKHEKIVLGLLSYVSSDLTIDQIKEIIEDYRRKEDAEIYLYYDEETENFIGLLAVTHHYSDDGHETTAKNITIDKIALIPSFRSEGFGFRMYQELKAHYPGIPILGTLKTVDIINHWMRQEE